MATTLTAPLILESDPTGTALTALPSVPSALTDSTGGTANTTLVAIGNTSTTNEGSKINDNFADLAAQVELLRTIVSALIERVQ